MSPKAQSTKHKSSFQPGNSTPGNLQEVTVTTAYSPTVDEPQSPERKVGEARRKRPTADPTCGGDQTIPGPLVGSLGWGFYWERTGGGFGVTNMLCSGAEVVATWLFTVTELPELCS